MRTLPPLSKMAPAEGAGYRREMMAASRLELNLVRLLCRCEAMAAEKRDPDEWRLEKVREICTVKQSPTHGLRRQRLTATGLYAPDLTAALTTPLPAGSATSTCGSRPIPSSSASPAPWHVAPPLSAQPPSWPRPLLAPTPPPLTPTPTLSRTGRSGRVWQTRLTPPLSFPSTWEPSRTCCRP